MKRWALIFNPQAGRFRTERLDAVQAALRAAGITPLPMATSYAGHARELATQVGGVGTVAVYGGDETLNETANGLAAESLWLFYLAAQPTSWRTSCGLPNIR